MAYEPLHHKYRPQTFSQLVGQDAIATTLSNALVQRRIAPAYLFCGPRGTGKTSSARILAKSLNCVNHPGPTPEPCGTCEICRAITTGSALDFVEIDAASNTGVDNIRELIERAQFAPVQCRYKVYVIDECLTGDALVLTQEGLFRIDDPTLEGKQALSYNETSGQWEFKRVVRWLNQGERPVLEIQTTHRKIRCTDNHLIRTDQGWIAARNVREGARILSPAPVAVAPSSIGSGQTDKLAASLEAINSGAIPTGKKPTALNTSLSRQSPYGLSVNAAVERNWISPNSSSRKEKGLAASAAIGRNTLTRSTTALGGSEPRSLSLRQALYPLKYWASSTERSWETLQLVTPTAIADFPDCPGHMGSNSKPGRSTKPLALHRSSPNSPLPQTKGTEKFRSAVAPFVTQNLQEFLPALSATGKARLYPSSGYLKFPWKGWPGGIWTMDPSALAPREVPKFNCIQKDILPKKTTSLLSGWADWAMPLKSVPISGGEAASSTFTLQWEQTPQGSGYQTCANIPFLQWTTNLETVVSVRPAGSEPVYDIEVEDNHNFVANGLLVHNCHMLSVAAFNALLKTLEEPPDRVVFVLATTDPQRVLPTIISRCQRFDYRRIPLENMVSHLELIAGKERIDIEAEAVRLVAQVSQGGLRDAESLLDQLSLLEPPITAEKVWDLVGAVPERDLLALARAIASDDGAAVLDQVRKLMDRGREPLIVLQNLAGFYRDLLIAKTAGSRQDLVALTPPTWAEMQTFAQSLDLGLILAGQQHLRATEVQVRNTTQPRLWLEVTLMGLLPSTLAGQMATSLPGQQTVSRPIPQPSTPLSANGKGMAAPPVSAAPPTPPPAPPTPAIAQQPTAPLPPAADAASPPAPSTSSPDLAQLWQRIVAVLQPLGTRALMQQQGSLLAFNGQTARIGINSQPLFKMAQGRVANIEEAFQQILQQKVKVSLEVVADGDAPPPAGSAPVGTPSPPPPPAPIAQEAPLSNASSPPVPASESSPTASAPPPSSVSSTPAANPVSPSALSLNDLPIESDFERAVKSFAQFFNGQVVSLDEETLGTASSPEPPSSDPTNAASPYLGPDSDVPF